MTKWLISLSFPHMVLMFLLDMKYFLYDEYGRIHAVSSLKIFSYLVVLSGLRVVLTNTLTPKLVTIRYERYKIYKKFVYLNLTFVVSYIDRNFTKFLETYNFLSNHHRPNKEMSGYNLFCHPTVLFQSFARIMYFF